MENETKTKVVKNYPLDFVIIGPKEDNQLGFVLQSNVDEEHYSFERNSILSELQRRVTEWNKLGRKSIDIGQHIREQYSGQIFDKPSASLIADVAPSTTTVKSGQALSINVEAFDDYFYVWQGKVSAVDRNKIQKEFTQRIPDIVKLLEQDDDVQMIQYLDPLVNMSIDATKAFETRTRQTRIARVIFAAVVIVLLFAYLQFFRY